MKKINLYSIFSYSLLAFLYLGYWFHCSDDPDIGPYSWGYFSGLVLCSLCLAIPWLIKKYVLKDYSSKDLNRLVVVSISCLGLLYAIGYLVYAKKSNVEFDPFLQLKPHYFEGVSEKKDSNTVRIICLGGSTTENVFVEKAGKYPLVLQELLSEKWQGKKVEVLNAGREWYASKHSLIHYVTYCQQFSPDYVLVMHAMNDLFRSFDESVFSTGDYQSDYSHYMGPMVELAKPTSYHSWLKKGWERGFGNRFMAGRYWWSSLRKNKAIHLEDDAFQSIVDFRKYLEVLSQAIEKSGAQPVLLTQPSLYKEEMTKEELGILKFGLFFCSRPRNQWSVEYPDVETMSRGMHLYNQVVKGMESENVWVFDVQDSIPKASDYFIDDIHYTEKGTRRLAEEVAECFKK